MNILTQYCVYTVLATFHFILDLTLSLFDVADMAVSVQKTPRILLL